MRRFTLLAIALIALSALVACGDDDAPNSDAPNSEAATAQFVACLERNGVTAEAVTLTLNDDGTVGTIEAQILAESDAPYEPAVRLACTQEIENR